MPVDIDYVYLPVKGRVEALQEICEALDAMGVDLKKAFNGLDSNQTFSIKISCLNVSISQRQRNYR